MTALLMDTSIAGFTLMNLLPTILIVGILWICLSVWVTRLFLSNKTEQSITYGQVCRHIFIVSIVSVLVIGAFVFGSLQISDISHLLGVAILGFAMMMTIVVQVLMTRRITGSIGRAFLLTLSSIGLLAVLFASVLFTKKLWSEVTKEEIVYEQSIDGPSFGVMEEKENTLDAIEGALESYVEANDGIYLSGVMYIDEVRDSLSGHLENIESHEDFDTLFTYIEGGEKKKAKGLLYVGNEEQYYIIVPMGEEPKYPYDLEKGGKQDGRKYKQSPGFVVQSETDEEILTNLTGASVTLSGNKKDQTNNEDDPFAMMQENPILAEENLMGTVIAKIDNRKSPEEVKKEIRSMLDEKVEVVKDETKIFSCVNRIHLGNSYEEGKKLLITHHTPEGMLWYNGTLLREKENKKNIKNIEIDKDISFGSQVQKIFVDRGYGHSEISYNIKEMTGKTCGEINYTYKGSNNEVMTMRFFLLEDGSTMEEKKKVNLDTNADVDDGDNVAEVIEFEMENESKNNEEANKE